MTFRNYKPAYARKLVERGLYLYGKFIDHNEAQVYKHAKAIRILLESFYHFSKAAKLDKYAKFVLAVLFPENKMLSTFMETGKLNPLKEYLFILAVFHSNDDPFSAFTLRQKLNLVNQYLLPSFCKCKATYHGLRCWKRDLKI